MTRMLTLTRLIPVTVDTFYTQTTCESPKTKTVARMATLTPLIPVTVDTFDIEKTCQNPKAVTVTDGDPDPPDPRISPRLFILLTCKKPCQSPKTKTVARMATPTRLTPATVDTLDARLPALAILLFTVVYFFQEAQM